LGGIIWAIPVKNELVSTKGLFGSQDKEDIMIRLDIIIAAAAIAALPITAAHAQSGTFRQAHLFGFGLTNR
jgi:hypothetical protein